MTKLNIAKLREGPGKSNSWPLNSVRKLSSAEYAIRCSGYADGRKLGRVEGLYQAIKLLEKAQKAAA